MWWLRREIPWVKGAGDGAGGRCWTVEIYVVVWGGECVRAGYEADGRAGRRVYMCEAREIEGRSVVMFWVGALEMCLYGCCEGGWRG
eukprot:1036421-Pleurochrysis_carterae.AAC.1